MNELDVLATKQAEVGDGSGPFPGYHVVAPESSLPPYRAVLLDDDPTYGKIVARFAEKRQVGLTVCANLEELKQKWQDCHAQVAIIDYDLNDFITGVDIARLLGETPVVLVSRKAKWIPGRESWSHNIKGFMHKKYGVPRLLDIAAECVARDAELVEHCAA